MRPIFAIAGLVIKEIFRKKDFYVALILTAVILFYAARLQFYNVTHIVRYLMEIGLFLVFAFSAILTVSLAARQYPSEIQNRTAGVLLAKPVLRLEFIVGKYLGSLAAGAACFFIFYALFLSVAWAKGGGLSAVLAAQTFFLFLLNLMVLAAMAGALSYYLTASASIAVTLILYFLVSAYGPDLKGAFYYGLPHFEFFDLRQRFIHDGGPISPDLVLFLTLYAVAYASLFLLLAWIRFRKKTL